MFALYTIDFVLFEAKARTTTARTTRATLRGALSVAGGLRHHLHVQVHAYAAGMVSWE